MNVDEEAELLNAIIDTKAGPRSMTKREAYNFYRAIQDHCEAAAMALQDELGLEEGDETK